MEFEKKIAVLGSTGSIGTQTLEIAREYKGIKIEAMSAHSNIDLIEKQAREFKPKTVCLTDEEKAKDLKIKIADTGIGISDVDKEHIFDRFYQGAKKEGSTGLGLAVVDAVCRLYGLKIAYSHADGRHCFTVDFPA